MRELGWIGALLVALLCGAPAAFAHEGHHAGTTLDGTVIEAAGDTLRVKSGTGEVVVTLTAKTEVRAGADSVGRDALRPGARVHVHGSKLPGGGFAAREVTIETAPRGAQAPDREAGR